MVALRRRSNAPRVSTLAILKFLENYSIKFAPGAAPQHHLDYMKYLQDARPAGTSNIIGSFELYHEYSPHRTGMGISQPLTEHCKNSPVIAANQ
jgi:hypothetical protein